MPHVSLRNSLLSVALVLGAGPAASQSPPDEIVRVEVPRQDLIVTADRIGRAVGPSDSLFVVESVAGATRLNELLVRAPGVSLVELGGRGRQTSLFTRGTNGNHTLVLLDGQDISDPSTPNGALNFAHLDLSGLSRVEFVRGPRSAVWGSQALGGVLNLIPATPGLAASEARIGYGSDESHEVAFRADLAGAGPFGLAVAGRVAETDGQTATSDRARGTARAEEDGYRNATVLGRARYTIGGFEAALTGWAVDTETDLDTSPEDPNAEERTTAYAVIGSLEGSFDQLKPRLSVAYVAYDRRDRDRRDARSATDVRVTNEGRRWRGEGSLTWQASDALTLVGGGELRHELYESAGRSDFGGFIITERTDADQDAYGLFLVANLNADRVLEGATLTAAVRYDDAESFEGTGSFALDLTYRLDPFDFGQTRLGASAATGFKIPSLYERFGFQPTNFGTSFRGNPDLEPEESRSFELSAAQSFDAIGLELRAVGFVTDLDNTIQTVFLPSFNSTTVNNVDAEITGAELSFDWSPVGFGPGDLSLGGSWTWLQAERADADGGRLLRRPRHALQGEVRHVLDLVGGSLESSLRLRHVGTRRDIGRFGGDRASGSYTLVDATAALSFERVRLELDATNLFDRDYEPADGFRGEGARVMGRVTLRP